MVRLTVNRRVNNYQPEEWVARITGPDPTFRLARDFTRS